jgi:Fe2+ or Zn2+ uptake regulation protein
VEVMDPQIEQLQDRLFKANGFFPQRHRMELYGICKKCKR